MFTKELEYIKEERIRTSADTLTKLLPEYFYHIPASSTGKYHPAFAQGEGGLVRHTKAAVRIAHELFEIMPYDTEFSDNEKDLIIFCLLIHDGLKKGRNEERYMRFDHPNLIAEFVEENKEKIELTPEELEIVESLLKTHMGKWTRDFKGKEILTKPSTQLEYFVHMCDYLSSKKCINMKFVENEIEEE